MLPNETYTFVIPGTPTAKGRARSRVLSSRGIKKAFVQHYTPEKTRKAEDNIRFFVSQKWGNKPPLAEPIKLTVVAYIPIPASWSNKKRQAAMAAYILPTPKPDLDNYVKLAMDACNEIVFEDDRYIVNEKSAKRYSVQPRLEITVTTMRSI